MTAPADTLATRDDYTGVELLLGQFAEEMAFVATGTDAGLLALNAILMDLEQAGPTDLPPALAAGLPPARRWLDQTLDGTGQFSAETLMQLTQWHDWMSGTLVALQTGTAQPAMPAQWQAPVAVPAVAPAVAAAVAAPVAVAAAVAAPPPPPPAGNEPSIQLKLPADAELLREFHAESVELLQNIEQGVLVLEDQPADTATINSIFRAFHTFKGGAGFLHLDALRDLAHELESLLEAVRRGSLAVTPPLIGLILVGADALARYTREIGAQLGGTNPGQPITVPTLALIARARAALRGELVAEVAPPVAVAVAAAPATAAEVGAAAPAPVPTAAVTAAVTAAPPRDAAGAEAGGAFVKLDTAKLDSLINLVGELVIAQSMVVQHPAVQNVLGLELVRNLRQLSRVTKELQRTVTSLRMVPIRGLFRKMGRLVRDLALQQQKQIQLVLEGEDTELDRNIVEKMGDPLVHMIRNAIDHAIELPADRVAQGKPALGTVRLAAAHQRGGIVIRIQDDGRGLDSDRIRQKAIERGLLAEDAELTPAEIYPLIFLPGFSTAAQITELSGRGVGMDIVRGNIESLRGKVEIDSTLGQGTTFRIVLPLTLAIIDGLIVGVGAQRYIIPTLAVRESFRPSADMLTTVNGRGEMVGVRGKQTPVLRLGEHFGATARATRPEDGILIVIESGDAARAILVDELLGKQEVVIKSLGRTFVHQHLVAGGAVLGDGSVGLILDVDTLVRMPPEARARPLSPSTGVHA